jgi:hypothetical protein
MQIGETNSPGYSASQCEREREQNQERMKAENAEKVLAMLQNEVEKNQC